MREFEHRLGLLFDIGLLSELGISEDGSRLDMFVRLPQRFDVLRFKELVELLTGRRYEFVELRFSGSLRIVLEEVKEWHC